MRTKSNDALTEYLREREPFWMNLFNCGDSAGLSAVNQF